MVSLKKKKEEYLTYITIIVRAVFEEDCRYYPQIFLDEYLYEL